MSDWTDMVSNLAILPMDSELGTDHRKGQITTTIFCSGAKQNPVLLEGLQNIPHLLSLIFNLDNQHAIQFFQLRYFPAEFFEFRQQLW